MTRPRSDEVDLFLARHSRRRESVLADAAPYMAMTPAERARHVDLACRMAAELLAASPYRERILAHRVAPHPSYQQIVKRLREQGRR